MFIFLYVYFVSFVYWVCLEVHKPFYIFPYAFYVLIFVALLYFYLRVCYYAINIFGKAFEFLRDIIKDKFSFKKHLVSDNQISVNSDDNHISENPEQSDGTNSEKSVDNTT